MIMDADKIWEKKKKGENLMFHVREEENHIYRLKDFSDDVESFFSENFVQGIRLCKGDKIFDEHQDVYMVDSITFDFYYRVQHIFLTKH